MAAKRMRGVLAGCSPLSCAEALLARAEAQAIPAAVLIDAFKNPRRPARSLFMAFLLLKTRPSGINPSSFLPISRRLGVAPARPGAPPRRLACLARAGC